MWVQVILTVPLPHPLTYAVPRALRAEMRPGVSVRVPLGRRNVIGFVSEVLSDRPSRDCREVIRLEAQTIAPATLRLLVWAANYYCVPAAEALRMGLGGETERVGRARYSLTTRGREALARADQILSVQGLEVEAEEKALLARLAKATRPLTKTVLLRDTGGSAAALDRLCRRGLATSRITTPKRSAPRTESMVSLAAPLDAQQADRLQRRSPRMWALIERLRLADGPVSLSALRKLDPGAGPRVKKMVAKGLLQTTVVEKRSDPFHRLDEYACPPVALNAAQQAVLVELKKALHREAFRPFLLHGVTGSGKTEVYLNLIGETLRLGKTALTLVPEIALTPQLAGRFHARFPGRVAVLHSGLTAAERRDSWVAIERGQLDIVVGARSALFAPLQNLGALIVDEEHDASFKQHEGMRYQARDLALVRAQQADAVVVLGSATPSLESYANTRTGRYGLLELPDRATARPLPVVDVVDLRRYDTVGGALSAPLIDAIATTLEKKQQVICFLNRRGFAPYLICRQCGEAARCPHCSVSLTWHKKQGRAVCHYCGHSIPTPRVCGVCGAPDPFPTGLGTERLAQILTERFPQARIARLDRDASHFGHLNRTLSAVRAGQIDILVGTQMVTKGHDFPNVTLVGVILADHGLNFPDFRSAERTFQLLCQVAGRAGRGGHPGRVIIQTYNPDHHSVVCSQQHDYAGFFETEYALRKRLGYPPAGYLASLRIDGPETAHVIQAAQGLAEWCQQNAPADQVAILGPAEAPLARLRGRSRWQVLLKSTGRKPLHTLMTALAAELEHLRPAGVRIAIDIDPIDMM
jgi:primosomal protein N' (replication factor Y)